jgi:hypothetical protein
MTPITVITKDAVSDRLRSFVAFELERMESRENLVFYSEGLEPNHIALHLFPEDRELRLLFGTLGLDESKSHHWRSLLQGLAKLFVEQRGSKAKWRSTGNLELARDLDEVWRKLFMNKKWRHATAADHLRKSPSFADRWGSEPANAFRMRISRFVRALGGMDESFVKRARAKYSGVDADHRFNFPDEDLE